MKKLLPLLLLTLLLTAVFSTTASAASDSSAGQVQVSYGTLNVRSGPSTTSAVLTQLGNSTYVTLAGKSGSWWQVEYANGQYGYCHESYISTRSSSPASVSVSYGSLNVRSGAGTGYAKTDSLPKGTRVLVLSSTNGWSRILYHGSKTGYVSAAYLSTNAAVALDVPNFKQTDKRWANTTIGSSGKTMAQIGCATTAIAMTESYRTGTTIYPNAMAQRLNYTASGSVYWPSHYTPVTASSGYLSAIYNQLKQGKSVLFGAKNSYGSQHWVVITGFTGGNLTSGNFTINDPGSNSRTTLSQFLNAYPTFYKYFTY